MFIFRRSSSCGDFKGKSLPSLRTIETNTVHLNKPSRAQLGQFGPYPTLPYPTLPHLTSPHPTPPHHTTPHHTTPHHTTPHHTLLYLYPYPTPTIFYPYPILPLPYPPLPYFTPTIFHPYHTLPLPYPTPTIPYSIYLASLPFKRKFYNVIELEIF